MTPLPEGFGLVLDRSVRSHRDGRVLAGGMPARAIALTDRGRDELAALLRGEPATEAARTLARRLTDTGLAHPRPPAPGGRAETAGGAPAGGAVRDIAVVIPVRDRPDELARVLGVLGDANVIVVDDGSSEPVKAPGATVVRRERAGGPGAARNDGVAAVTTELVAFLDSDCVPPRGWLEALGAWFDDPLVGAVAPRVAPRTGGGLLGSFAAARSPLDMGPHAARVAPGTPVAYVPTAALVVRRAALTAFDEALRFGEDVDLVWRLHDAGWRVRYDPSVVVEHEEPRTWAGLLARRMRYGTSAAPLSRRHPGRLRHVVLRTWPAAAAALLLARRPTASAAILAVQAALLARKLDAVGVPRTRSARWSAAAVFSTLVGASRAAAMLWLPALALAIAARRTRPAAIALLLAAPAEEWVRRRPKLDPLTWTLLSIADDAAYGLGVWRGCLREREAGPLGVRGAAAAESNRA